MSASNTVNDKNRISAACSNCHDRKVRCDAQRRGFPCSNCINSQRPNCRKHEKRKRLHGRSSSRFVPIKAVPTTQSSHQSDAVASITEGQESNQGIVGFLDQKDTTHRSILRGVRMTYVGKDVSNLNFIVRQRDGEINETAFHFSSDDIASRFNPHTSDRIPQEAFILPEQTLADSLVEAYFTHVNIGCPIVDEETFMSQYRRRDDKDPPSLLLLQTIFLVGAHVSQARPDRDILKAIFFRRAKMLFDGRLEKNRDFVVQAALLLTWHSDGADDVAANSWFWVGIAARTAIGLGMHYDIAPLNRTMHPDMHTFRRIWWILFQYDVTVSLLYGRPQAINLDECNVKPLTASDFQGCGPNVQIDYVIQCTELCILISQILRERFGLRVSKERRKTAVTNADKALADWCLNLPNALQLRSWETDIWTSSLYLTYSNFLILLHRPHPRATKGSDDYGPNDSDICGTAANTITSIFESLRSRDMIKYLWISDINALFTAMVQVSVELRFSNPVLAVNALRRFDSSLLSLRKLAEYWTNAESILRIFEESSQLQYAIRLGERVKEQDQAHDNSSNSSNHYSGELSVTQQMEIEATESDTLVASASDSTSNPRETNSWRDLFPTSDSATDDYLALGELAMDNEWREIYWQEPGMSELFGDGFWSWP